MVIFIFAQTVHSCILKPGQMSWYTERSLTELSLGGLLILVVIRWEGVSYWSLDGRGSPIGQYVRETLLLVIGWEELSDWSSVEKDSPISRQMTRAFLLVIRWEELSYWVIRWEGLSHWSSGERALFVGVKSLLIVPVEVEIDFLYWLLCEVNFSMVSRWERLLHWSSGDTVCTYCLAFRGGLL